MTVTGATQGRRRLPKVRGDLVAPRLDLPTFTRAQLQRIVHSGENDADVCERALAQASRTAAALDLAIGALLAELLVGDRLMALGFSCLKDYAENILGMSERTAQAAVQLARALADRPILRAAVREGEVSPRKALTILRVARGDAEAYWTLRARDETVRSLLGLVRAALTSRPGALPGADVAEELAAQVDDPLELLDVRIPSAADRAQVAEALERAEQVAGSGSRAIQLLALAQEYLGGHPLDEDGEREAAELAAQRDARVRRERQAVVERRLEVETEHWAYLEQPRAVPAPDLDLGWIATPEDLDAQIHALATERIAWDDLVGYCAHAVKESRLRTVAGFASWRQYSRERLGLSPRVVEQRAALEKRLWEVPALRQARDCGLAYSKLLVLSALPDAEIPAMAARARKLTVVELREAVAVRVDAQMCAAGIFRAWVPRDVDLTVREAFVAACRTAGAFPDGGQCLVLLARHFNEVWKDAFPKPRTKAQRVRARDRRCQVPGCSRPAGHSHHVEHLSLGGDDSEVNQVGDCPPHHLRGIHGGYIQVSGLAPDGLTWIVGGKIWKDAEFGRGPGDGDDGGDGEDE